jgi:hypothetical protein
MTPESDKIMFECYRETTYSRRYRVVYFTELDEHERDTEISAALAGEHFVSGFIRAADIVAARQVMRGLIERLNAGEPLSPEAFEEALQSYSVV